jgi:uridine nucleosidase
MPSKIIIDTDPGVDDTMAILFALSSPELDLLGLTAVFGNGQVAQLAQNAIHVLDVAGRPDIPVAKGASRPLARAYRASGEAVHGDDGLGNIFLPPPRRAPLDIPAAQFIVETVMRQPGEVTLIAVGPLTNVALAVRLEPRLVSAVKQVIIMGGAAFCRGNISAVAEANIYNDPEAARIVFEAGWPLTMVGLDVTSRTVMTARYLAELGQLGNVRTDFIARIIPFYLNFYREYEKLDGIFTHDPSAIAYALDPSLFTILRAPVFVETQGQCAGQTVADLRHQWITEPVIDICTEVDSARLLELFKARLSA